MSHTTVLIARKLSEKGIRPSVQRIKVMEYMLQKGGHPTVDDIFEALLPEIPSLSRTTVYNTLHSFVRAGLARIVSIDGVEARYDVLLHSHGHFKCEKCGAIFNFKIDINHVPFEDLTDFLIKEKDVYFSGLCPSCHDSGYQKKEMS